MNCGDATDVDKSAGARQLVMADLAWSWHTTFGHGLYDIRTPRVASPLPLPLPPQNLELNKPTPYCTASVNVP